MRKSAIIVLGASIALALVSPVMAQGRGGSTPRQTPTPTPTPRGDQLQTQDRLKDQDKLHDQDQLKDQDKLHDQDQLRDQDKLHDQDKLQDRDRLHDQDGLAIYASELMTPAERSAYMTRMRSLKTVQERNAYREQHRIEMQQRARERGVSIPSGSGQNNKQQGSEDGN
ncbi:hypothetical protein [Cognatiluteimonas profundi]|uniref:hypothetical protein n=1 Tax=Cognatiluteimonas profundi TaxID=2594501 RepID=UPI00131E863D|nr:hypothetical protein [Lysobacter profundi]